VNFACGLHVGGFDQRAGEYSNGMRNHLHPGWDRPLLCELHALKIS
jgi:hypothetical protein